MHRTISGHGHSCGPPRYRAADRGSTCSWEHTDWPARTKVWLELNGRFIIGEGGLKLLLAIRETGSFAAALRRVGWSYRHGWGDIRRAEDALGSALTRSRPGKGAARGTELTPVAELLIRRVLRLRRQVDRLIGPSGPTAGEIADACGRESSMMQRLVPLPPSG